MESYLENDGLAFRLRCLAENVVHNFEIFVPWQSRGIVLIEVIDEIVQQEVSACKVEERGNKCLTRARSCHNNAGYWVLGEK